MKTSLKEKSHRLLLIAIILSGLMPAAHAERDLTITSVSLNGFTAREIRVKPGARISGSVDVQTMSMSLFRTHTAVWQASWQRGDQNGIHVFLNSIGGSDKATANIDIAAPTAPGTYHLLFCFDRKRGPEMLAEINLRTEDQIWASGRAVRIIVDPSAVEAPKPNSKEAAGTLTQGTQIQSIAGNAVGAQAWWKFSTGSLSSLGRDDAIRFRLVGLSPNIDLDMEILDQSGRRRGYSENEGSGEESSVVRVSPNEVLYARVFAFKPNEEAAFKLVAERVALSASRHDPSQGKALAVGNGYSATGHAADGSRAAWYAVPLAADGRIEAEIRGTQPTKDLDLIIFDDLGNPRAISRENGSALERCIVDPAESGVYYIRVQADRATAESDFAIVVRVTNPAITVNPGAPVPVSVAGFDSMLRLPVAFDVAPGRDFEAYFKVQNETAFTIEVKTGYGDVGKIDSIVVTAPDGAVLWAKRAEGRGWEAERLTARGAGVYRILISNSVAGTRRGQIDITGLSDSYLYRSLTGIRPGDLGAGGPGLDGVEKQILQNLYDMMSKRGSGISVEESDLLRQMDDYFSRN